MSFTKLPALEPIAFCGCCPPKPQTLPLEYDCHPGFGGATLTCDGAYVEWGDERGSIAQDAEDRAAGDPDHDWRICIDAPLYEAEYQRQGEREWVLVRKGQGFA